MSSSSPSSMPLSPSPTSLPTDQDHPMKQPVAVKDEEEEVEKNDMIDITKIFELASGALTFADPMLCNKESFNLQDSMAALELMDRKMDCCEIPAPNVAPYGADADANRMVFPRPAPTGLDDAVESLPWNDLTIQDAAFIVLESLVRLESLLGGASVVESTFTCLYTHKVVLRDMQSRLEPISLTEQMQAIMKPKKKGTTPQHIVYASTLILLELTDVLRSIILNADIYEEEDFTVSTYNVQVFDNRDETSATISVNHALMMVSALDNQDSDEVRLISLILSYQLDLLTVSTSLARLAGKTVRKVVEEAQSLSKKAAKKLDEVSIIVKRLKENETDATKALIRQTFDSCVNRPLVGNAPVRKIVFREPSESLKMLTKITREMDWALCTTLLRGNTLGRIRRMLGTTSVASVNILTRSLLVLNLYFDDKLLGQYHLTDMIMMHMQQLSHVPDKVFAVKSSHVFLNRLAKPIYDMMKVLVLNRNRQRAYMEAVMLPDWASLRQEAHIVDVSLQKEGGVLADSQPHYSLYVLYITISLMDHYVNLGIELKLFYGEHDLGVAFWYRDFLLSSLISQISAMRRAKVVAKQAEAAHLESQSRPNKGKKKGGKHQNKRHANGGTSSAGPPPPRTVVNPVQDAEDECEFLLLNLERGICRGVVRFLAALNQAGLVPERNFGFTSRERIFEKRFEAFSSIQQPPPLRYSDYMQGSDFSKVTQSDLLLSTADCFSVSKSMVDKLMTQIKSLHVDYLPTHETELRTLTKVCVGNSVYIQKLKQKLDKKSGKAMNCTVVIDQETHNQFCTIKIS